MLITGRQTAASASCWKGEYQDDLSDRGTGAFGSALCSTPARQGVLGGDIR
jgi:hypothetical protein